MAKAAPSDITNAELSEKLDTLSQSVEKFTATIPVLIQQSVEKFTATIPVLIQQQIDELAASVQRGFTAMQVESAREHAELREENVREHAKTRSMIEDKADLYEVVKHPEFDRLEQRVTQLELK